MRKKKSIRNIKRLNMWLIKSEEASLNPIGTYPGARDIKEYIRNGIIVLDKPRGPTSHTVDSYVKKILDIGKASHGGTLDPKVSGVLVIALENSTKLMPILLSSRKEYVGIAHLHKDLLEDKIKETFKEFIGKQEQLPPKKSAVARRIRTREVYSLEVLEIKKRDVLFRVECEAGFYVRRLADDIGKKLGGAHLTELRRIRSGPFKEENSFTLQNLIDAHNDFLNGNEDYLRRVIIPMENSFDNRSKLIIRDNAISTITNGSPLYVGGILRLEDNIKKGDIVGMFSVKGELVAFGIANMSSNEILKNKKGLAIKTDRVLMKRI